MKEHGVSDGTQQDYVSFARSTIDSALKLYGAQSIEKMTNDLKQSEYYQTHPVYVRS